MTQLPTLELKKLLDTLITWVADNYTSHTDKTQSWLYNVFYGNVTGNFDFYTQAIELINRDEGNPRKLETRLTFDKDRADLPTIFITVPGETKDGPNAISMNSDSDYYEDSENETFSYPYERHFKGTFDLMITSTNSLESMLIYELLICLFIASADSLQNLYSLFEYSGKDLMPNKNVTNFNLYIKTISLTLTYKREVPSIVSSPLGGTGITSKGDFINN